MMLKTLKTIDYHNELIETQLKGKSGPFGSHIVATLFFIYILKDFVPIAILIAIMLIQIISYIFRTILVNKILKNLYISDKKTVHKLLKYYLSMIFINSFLLGISGMLTVLYAGELQLFMYIAVMSAIVAGAMTSLSSIFHAVFIYIVVSFSIIILSLVFIGGTTTYYFAAFMLIIFIVAIVSSSFRINQSISNNITQQEALTEKNSNFQNLLDMTMEAIILTDSHYNIIDINESGVMLFKMENKSDAIGINIIEYVPDYELLKLQNAMQNERNDPYEIDLRKYNGETFPTLLSSSNMIMDGKQVRIGTVLDLTQIKEKEQQLIHQSRLAQMGEMISMIAHQWRQPLSAISGTANNLALNLMFDDIDKEEFTKEIELIIGYSQHLSHTIDDFRDFFEEEKEKETLTLEEIVTRTLNIIKVSVENKNIKIETHFNCPKLVTTYVNEVNQVVLNLIRNAEDILLERKIKNPTIIIEALCEDNNLLLRVKDNGGGIPESIIDRVFDPYFSTKKEKDGTGLGLYMSKTIIYEHCNGKLSVKNDEYGAVFTIVLPEALMG